MAIETTLKVNGDSTDAQRDQRNLREDLEETGDAIERIGRESREMGRDVGQGARQAERALVGMGRAADDADGIMSRLGDGALDVAGGLITAETATMLVETAVDKMVESFGRFVAESPAATREADRFRAAVAGFDRTFRQSAFGDGTGVRAIREMTEAMDHSTGAADEFGGIVADFLEIGTAAVGMSNAVNDAADGAGFAGDAMQFMGGAIEEAGLRMVPGMAQVRDLARTIRVLNNDVVDVTNATHDAVEPLDGFADMVRDVRRELGQIEAPPSTGRVLDFFTDATEHALNASRNVQAFRENIQRLTGADIFHLEGDEPQEDDRAATARVEREESVLDEIKGKREEARAEEYQAMLEAQEREAQLMAERKARLDEIAMLRAEQDEERAAMAEEKAMMLHEREFERMEALAEKEEEIQQRRRDAVSAYLGGFDRQVADAIVGSQSLEDAMRASFGGIASAAADAAIAQAGILLFTPGGQKAAIGLFAAATAARVIASALGHQGAAGGGSGGGGQTVRNTQVSVTVAGEGGNVQTGRAVAESVRDAIERGAA